MIDRLEVRCAGEGPPLILVHGIQGNADAWNAVLPALVGEYRCIMPNLPGRKLSTRWRSEDGPIAEFYSLHHYAEILAALVERHGHAGRVPVRLAGWSMGVSVILAYAQRFGLNAIARMALCSGTPKAAAGALWFQSDTLEGIMREAQQRAERLGLKDPADHDAVAWSWRAVRDADHVQLLSTIHVPTLVIHGEQDDDCPVDHGRQMATAIQDAQWCPLPGVGHSVFGDASATVADALSRFFRG